MSPAQVSPKNFQPFLKSGDVRVKNSLSNVVIRLSVFLLHFSFYERQDRFVSKLYLVDLHSQIFEPIIFTLPLYGSIISWTQNNFSQERFASEYFIFGDTYFVPLAPARPSSRSYLR